MNYVVYCHTNRVNGKPYVGWTVIGKRKSPYHAMMHRWYRYCAGSSKCKWLFGRAIHKWGRTSDDWDHEILEVTSTEESIKHAEVLWIARRKTFAFDPDGWGYNMTRGGDGGCGVARKGKKLGPYKPRTAEHAAAISAALKGHVAWNKGQPSPLKGIKRGPNKHPTKMRSDKGRIGLSNDRPVRQLSLSNEVIATFLSIAEVHRLTGMYVGNIGACCRGKRNKTQGFRWEWA